MTRRRLITSSPQKIIIEGNLLILNVNSFEINIPVQNQCLKYKCIFLVHISGNTASGTSKILMYFLKKKKCCLRLFSVCGVWPNKLAKRLELLQIVG